MPLELKSFRLQKEWGRAEDQNSPRLYLKNSSDLDLPISGGWGYSAEDCVVIDKNDPTIDPGAHFNPVSVEYVFFEKRVYAELIVFRPREDRFSGINWELKTQSLRAIDGHKMDVLKFRVTAFTDLDWEYLKNEWETNLGYVDDEEGKESHKKERHLRTRFYDTECWFRI